MIVNNPAPTERLFLQYIHIGTMLDPPILSDSTPNILLLNLGWDKYEQLKQHSYLYFQNDTKVVNI